VKKLFFLRCSDCQLMRLERRSRQQDHAEEMRDAARRNGVRQQCWPKTTRWEDKKHDTSYPNHSFVMLAIESGGVRREFNSSPS
jgi:hypothetical protein